MEAPLEGGCCGWVGTRTVSRVQLLKRLSEYKKGTKRQALKNRAEQELILLTDIKEGNSDVESQASALLGQEESDIFREEERDRGG